MKTNLLKYSLILASTSLIVACSTKKDKWINRNFQALNTKYNVLYNGNMALQLGIQELNSEYKDNFWEVLPIERMTVSKDEKMPGDNMRNANFERAEDKATKAIQKRSMNIDGKERNPQMDEAHLLLGQARYYDQRFIPALEAFNYVLYKYSESDKIYDVKIWREKTNMRLENNSIAITNLQKLLKEIKLKDQTFADANATMAQAYLNEQMIDSAIVKLKIAHQYSKVKEEKARYKFILGQLFEKTNQNDSAFVAYQAVIDMKRNAAKPYVIHAIGRQTLLINAKDNDTNIFNKKYKNLLEDRENRPFLSQLNHQLAMYYDKNQEKNRAISYYNKSLRQNTDDQYLKASNYRNLATIYFDRSKYLTAGQYYDSTMIFMNPSTREFKNIQKKRTNLNDVIKYETIAKTNDSLLSLIALSDTDKNLFFEKHIAEIKAKEEQLAKLEKKKKKNNSNEDQFSGNSGIEDKLGFNSSKSNASGGSNSFYFYNASTVAYGKNEFKRRWGKRPLAENWRWASLIKNSTETPTEDNKQVDANEVVSVEVDKNAVDPKYTTEFYTSQIPTRQTYIDTLKVDRNFAYYQLGVIYKEKFSEYELAAQKLENLLNNQPEERLILPTYYNLYKIYEIINPEKAVAMKSKILSEYPHSRYAQILSSNNGENLQNTSPEKAYIALYKIYESGDILLSHDLVVKAVDEYVGDEMLPKFELLKAHIVGKLNGVEQYKSALNYVALTYPNALEGKEAESLIQSNIPILERLKFDSEKPKTWKIIYPIQDINSKSSQDLITKLNTFAKERTMQKLSVSKDVYTLESYFVVLHGIPTEDIAKDIDVILKDYKDYKISNPSSIISTENYKVVQARKNYDQYLLPRQIPTSYPEPEPYIPVQAQDQKSGNKPNEAGQNQNKNNSRKEDSPNRSATPKPPGRDKNEAEMRGNSTEMEKKRQNLNNNNRR